MLQVGLCNLDGVICVMATPSGSLCLRVLIRALLSLRADIRCPFCSKSFPGGRIEDHLLSCLTSPPLPYNSKYPIPGGAWCSKLMVAVCLPVRVCVCVRAKRTCSVKTAASAPSVWRIWHRERPSPGCLASASTTRGKEVRWLFASR